MSERTVYEITRAIAARMSGVSVDVFYGEERFERYANGIAMRSLIEVRELGPETIGPTNTTRGGVRPSFASRLRSVVVNIEGASTRSGATEADHVAVVNELLERFWFALLAVTDERREPVDGRSGSGGFEDAEGIAHGARYVLNFRIQTSLREPAPVDAIDSGLLQSGTTRVLADGATQNVCEPEI